MKPQMTTAILFTAIMTMISCVQKTAEMVGPTIGTVNILADESCRYIISQEEEIFERNYPYAHVNISYAHELDLLHQFLNDSTKVIMTTRKLTEEEKTFLNSIQSIPREFPYATSAIAFVRPSASPDTTITYEDLFRLMTDEASGTTFVLENAKSGIAEALLTWMNRTKLPSHVYALDTKKEVFAYIDTHPSAIGIIDYADISDSDNPYTKSVLERINLMGISRPADSTQVGFVKPYQYNLQDRKYPFTRDLYIITRTGKSDVSLGFASFICGEIGQKIVLKSGLLPMFQSERVIEFTPSEDIKVVK